MFKLQREFQRENRKQTIPLQSHVLLDELDHLLGHFLGQVDAGHLDQGGDGHEE